MNFFFENACHHLFLEPSASNRCSHNRTESSSRACLKYARNESFFVVYCCFCLLFVVVIVIVIVIVVGGVKCIIVMHPASREPGLHRTGDGQREGVDIHFEHVGDDALEQVHRHARAVRVGVRLGVDLNQGVFAAAEGRSVGEVPFIEAGFQGAVCVVELAVSFPGGAVAI